MCGEEYDCMELERHRREAYDVEALYGVMDGKNMWESLDIGLRHDFVDRSGLEYCDRSQHGPTSCTVPLRVHILDPATVAIDSRVLSFWPYGDVKRDTL